MSASWNDRLQLVQIKFSLEDRSSPNQCGFSEKSTLLLWIVPEIPKRILEPNQLPLQRPV